MCRQIKTDDYVGDDRRKYEEWHLDKNVPISIIAALLLYAGFAIWWGSKMQGQIENLNSHQREMAVEAQERMHDKLLNNRIDNIHKLLGPINQTLIRMDIRMANIVPSIQITFREHEDRVLKQIEKHDIKDHDK